MVILKEAKDQLAPRAILVVGQAPPRGAAEYPYARTRLWRWLATVNVERSTAAWRFEAVLQAYPGRRSNGDKPPTRAQIDARRVGIVSTIKESKPDMIIALGTSAAELLTGSRLPLDRLVGQEFLVEGVPVAVLPHPSGRNTWLFADGERTSRFQAALASIARVALGDDDRS